jgi:thiamine-phosphate pyrophosphorylase
LCKSKRTGNAGIFPAKRPLFYYITDRKRLQEESLLVCVRKAVEWGVDFIQIREKDLDDRELYDLTCQVLATAQGTQCRILVNGRPDIALASGAHGVHLPSMGPQISDIRRWFPRKLLIGVSVHTSSEIRRACRQGAHYLLLGHVFGTDSKLGYGPPLGIDFLKKACSSSSVPVFGLGGIKQESIWSVIDAGAAGVAGIGLFQDAGYRILDAKRRMSHTGSCIRYS